MEPRHSTKHLSGIFFRVHYAPAAVMVLFWVNSRELMSGNGAPQADF